MARVATVFLAAAIGIVGSFAAPSSGAVGVEAVDVGAQAGIQEITSTWSANLRDYDKDGWEDWLFVRHNRVNEVFGATASLYHNNRNGGFTETKQFPVADRHDCAWADVNQDGRPDAFCSIGASKGTATDKSNELWLQQSDGTWVERAQAYGVSDPLGRGRYATFIDVNHDPHPDLFLGNYYPRQDGLPSPNRLFINQGGTGFRDAAGYGLDKEIGAFCAWAADYNGDGWRDLLVCGKDSHGLRIYRNDQGTSFTDVTEKVGVTGFWNDAQLVDYDGDGRLDLAQVRAARFQVRLQGTDGTFKRPSFGLSLTAGETLAGGGDINRDGAPDIYIVQSCVKGTPGNTRDFMLVNDGSGSSFSQTPIPDTAQGCGDNVSSLDYNRNGQDDYIVTNGNRTTVGPTQLISFR